MISQRTALYLIAGFTIATHCNDDSTSLPMMPKKIY